MSRRIVSAGAAVLLVGLATAAPAVAGPSLLCHPFNIGSSPSLPWDGSNGWRDGRADYNVANLVSDTEALLVPSMPVVVRMETLRRAAIYASRDGQVATQLLVRLMDRLRSTAKTGRPDPIALFDAGYYAETLKQIGGLGSMPEFKSRASSTRAVAADVDGYAMITKSLILRPNDASLEFAAALVAADRDRTAYQEHSMRARAGAKDDVLLTINLDHIAAGPAGQRH
jgi:hypothetical protein